MGLSNNIDIHEIYDLVKQLSDVYRSLLVTNDAVASGKLKDFTTEVKVSDNSLDVIYNLPKYWSWVEDGRPPSSAHKPPALQPSILQWIKDKNIQDDGRHGKPMSQEQLSWAITKAIHAKGFSGRPMLAQSLYDGKPIIEQIANKVEEVVGREIDLTDLFDGLEKKINF